MSWLYYDRSLFCLFFFFKQKTAYEMRISDWSSDVCSSDLERDGVSVEHAARFVLVGTMNPEEGELRPQLLDRFGLTVEVAAPRDPSLRVEVVRRRIAFESDPVRFATSYAEDERALTDRILAAQKLVSQVLLGDAALLKLAEICAAFDVAGMRPGTGCARASVAQAAWPGP